MRRHNPDLHGNAPDKCDVALLLIDVINDLEFEDGALLFEHALPAARRIAALKVRCRKAGVPVVYVNDHFGRWRSDFHAQVRHCVGQDVRGQPIAELLRPDEHDYFVLKPKHSGFYSTALALLLDDLEVRTLILAGFAGNICVLFTAHDAYMRDFGLAVPADCIASNTEDENRAALDLMHRILKADVRESKRLKLPRKKRPRSAE